MLVDATGIGLAIADMLQERGLSPRMILFTGSERVSSQPNGVTHVGKAWLVSRLQVLLQGQRIHLPQTAEAATLVRELQEYRVEINDRGHASFNARSGAHDDLVIALGLACGVDPVPGSVTVHEYARSRAALEPIAVQRAHHVRRLGR